MSTSIGDRAAAGRPSGYSHFCLRHLCASFPAQRAEERREVTLVAFGAGDHEERHQEEECVEERADGGEDDEEALWWWRVQHVWVEQSDVRSNPE